MKVLATILVLLISVVGFVFSYEMAYKKIVKVMLTSGERTLTVNSQTR